MHTWAHCAFSPFISSYLSYIAQVYLLQCFNGCIVFQDKVVLWGTWLSFDGYWNYFHFGGYIATGGFPSHMNFVAVHLLFSAVSYSDPHPSFLLSLGADPDILHASFPSLRWLPFVLWVRLPLNLTEEQPSVPKLSCLVVNTGTFQLWVGFAIILQCKRGRQKLMNGDSGPGSDSCPPEARVRKYLFYRVLQPNF